jgi:hypothetical protein
MRKGGGGGEGKEGSGRGGNNEGVDGIRMVGDEGEGG